MLLSAALVFGAGAAVLLGWMIGSEPLMTVLPGHVSMKSDTAVCFMAAAVGLAACLSASSAARWVSRAAAAVVSGFGAATLVEYAAGIDLRIDQIFFGDPVQSPFPGRMAHITAVGFCVAGLALLGSRGGFKARRISEFASLVLATMAFAAMTGYVYGVPVLYGSAGYTSMAFHTGIAFLLLSAGLLLAPADSILASLLTAPQRGSWLARRMLPAALVIPPTLGWLYLRPSFSFGSPVFAMALFAVTLTALGIGMLWLLANFFNRGERQTVELALVREQSAAAIQQSEQELRLITDHLPTLLSYIDPEGRFVRVNRTYETWMGVPAHEIVGRTVAELLGTTYWEKTQTARKTALQGLTVTFEAEYPTIRGERHTQVTYAPDVDEAGNVRGMACLVLDLHDRRQAETALRQSEKLAAVGRLASSIAHEINNPLEAVTNLLYLAALETAGQGVAEEYVVQAQAELARVTHIVTQTLRFHRQAAGPVLCRVSDLLSQVLVLYQGRLAQANIAVEQRLRDKEPLLCRDGEIRQVLANLVGNAADAMQGGGRLLVRTTAATDPRTGQPGVRVTIADTGHGISEATRRNLFEPFHTTKGATGSGLGLWISKEIIARHSGHVRLRSSVRPGKSGTVFQVFLSLLNVPTKA